MKCRTCYAIVRHARQCDDCTRQAAEDLGVVALDERGEMPQCSIWPLLLAVVAAVATAAAYLSTYQPVMPVAID